MCDVLLPEAPDKMQRFTTDLSVREPDSSAGEVLVAPIVFRCGDSDECDELDPDEQAKMYESQENSGRDLCIQSWCTDKRIRKSSAPASVAVECAAEYSGDPDLSLSCTHLGSSEPSDPTNSQLLHFDAATSAPYSLFCLDSSMTKPVSCETGPAQSTPFSEQFNSSYKSPSSAPYLYTTPISAFSRQSSNRLSGWYYSLAPSYKSKLEQFRRIFRGTPVDTERLLVDYSCALSKNNHGLLQQGRMYITENWVCFYSKILSEQKIYLAVKEIFTITKEKTARVIPNAIQIIYSKSHQRFFFTSFSSRERTYAILRKVWENCRNNQTFIQANQTMTIDEIVHQVREIYGDDSLAMLDDEDTDGDPDHRRNLYPPLARTTSDSSNPHLTSVDTANDTNGDARLLDSDNGANNSGGLSGFATTDEDEYNEDGLLPDRVMDLDTHELPDTTEHGPGRRRRCKTPEFRHSVGDSAETDPALHETQSAEHLPLKAERKRRSRKRTSRNRNSKSPTHPHRPEIPLSLALGGDDLNSSVSCFPGHDHPGQLYADALIPLGVDALFTCIFTDSVFFDRLTTARGTFNMAQSSWPDLTWLKSDREGKIILPRANAERTIKYTLKLNQRLGPRTCAAIEQQTLLVSESQPGRCYVVDAKVTNQAVPLCNCFCVVSRYCLLRVDRTSSRLSVSSRVVYEKPVFFGAKSIIENTCRSGLTDFFTSLVTQLTEMASSLDEQGRLTGGILSTPSTSTDIKHDGIRTKDVTAPVAQRGTVHNQCSEIHSAGSLPKHGVDESKSRTSPPSPAYKHQYKPSVTSGNTPSFVSQSTPLNEIGYFFLRPDRAWLLLVVISLLLCLCLSMVYNRLIALERLAEQLSETRSFPKFGGSSFLDQASTQFNWGPSSFEASQSRLRVIKDLTLEMSKTLNQMQQVLSQVHQTIELLDHPHTASAGSTTSHSILDSTTSDSSCLLPSQACQPT